MSEHAIDALNRHADRQDQRLDDHGKRIKGIETREAAVQERVQLLTHSVDRLTNAIYTVGGLIVLAAVTVLIFGGQ